jgi:hypothetical protein
VTDVPDAPTGGSTLVDSPAGPAAPPPDSWVPPDQRILGLDKRSLWPAIALLVIWFVWAHAMPWINEQIELDAPIVAGDVVDLGGGEYVFVPTVGWNLEAGVLVRDGERSRAVVPATGIVATEGVVYKARSAPWDGSPDELLDQMIDLDDRLNVLIAADERGRSDITNIDGVPGRLAYVLTEDEAVLLATFVFEAVDEGATPVGVEIEVTGTPSTIRERAEDIARMIDSTRFAPVAEEAQS